MADAETEESDSVGARAGALESWGEALVLLPRRAMFVAVALVQIAVELAARTLRADLIRRDEGGSDR